MERAQLPRRCEEGKLIAAGEHWANASPADSSEGKSHLENDMDAFGLSDELKSEILGDQEARPKDFIVSPENSTALDVFLFCQTQWRQSMSGITGLDYTAVISVISVRVKKKQRPKVLDDVRLIESGALRAISEKMRE